MLCAAPLRSPRAARWSCREMLLSRENGFVQGRGCPLPRGSEVGGAASGGYRTGDGADDDAEFLHREPSDDQADLAGRLVLVDPVPEVAAELDLRGVDELVELGLPRVADRAVVGPERLVAEVPAHPVLIEL